MPNHEFQDLDPKKLPQDKMKDLSSVEAGDLGELEESLSQSILATEELDDSQAMLDKAPDIAEQDAEIQEFSEQLYQSKFKKLKIASSVLCFSLLAVFSFSWLQGSKLNARLELVGVDPSTQVSQLQTNLEAEIVTQGLLNQSLHSQIVAYKASQYYKDYKKLNSPLINMKEKQNLYTSLLEQQIEIGKLMQSIKNNLNLARSSTLEQSVKSAYQESLQNKLQKYQGQEVSLFSPAYTYSKLNQTMQEGELIKLLNEYPGDQVAPDQFLAFLRAYFQLHADSYLDTLAMVDLSSFSILHMFNELEKATQAIDAKFSFFGNPDAQITYTNYNLNPEKRTVSISTSVKTKDPQTFTLLAQLYESLSDSILFEQATPSNLAKTQSEQGVYSSSLSINLKLNSKY